MFSIRKIFAKKENMESNIAINREISQGGGIVLPIKKINPMEKWLNRYMLLPKKLDMKK